MLLFDDSNYLELFLIYYFNNHRLYCFQLKFLTTNVDRSLHFSRDIKEISSVTSPLRSHSRQPRYN